MTSYFTFTASIYIGDILQDLGEALPASTWAVIRCLDSGRDPDSIRLIAARHGISSCVGGYPTVELKRLAASRKLFSHFDELWFFCNRPQYFSVDVDKACLTSDRVDLDTCTEWAELGLIETAGSFLAIGDGDYANIVVANDMARLLPHSLR